MEIKVEYERLMPHEFEERITACPIIYVPVGSLEWHGEHLALGNDSLKMHALCCEAARLSGGIVYPPIYYCIPHLTDGNLAKYRHNPTFHGQPEMLRSLLLSTLAGLEAIGFKVAILTTGHTPREQIQMMRDVAAQYKGKMKVHGTCDMDFAKSINFTSDHAAKWETSILWSLHPGLVDLTQLPKDLNEELFGVGGEDPRVHASPSLGRKAVQAVAADMASLATSLLGQR